MSGSVEIVLWLHEYKYQALENRLAQDGRDIEKAMQEMLIDLYSECVPFEEQQAIRERIDAEHAEAVAEQMANTTWAAYHITGGGEDLYFKTSKADTLLVAAKRLRTYLTAEDNPLPVSFAAVFKDHAEITQAEYDQLLDQRLQNTGKVSGVFEIDFDRDTFSAANAMDGWHTYRIHDVSVAAYHAYRKQNISTDQRWDRLLDKLDGKELTPNSDVNSKSEFVLNCFRELLDDGEPHRYREIIDYVREQAKGTQYEGTIEQNNLVLPISKKLEDPAFPYARVSHGIYQKTEQSPVLQESVGCHTPSAYDLLDILFVVQRQMEVIHKTQQEEFPSSKTLEQSFQVVSGHLETLLDSMSMWIADMEDLTQEPPQEHKNEALTGMQMG